jgi:hypothetical protein
MSERAEVIGQLRDAGVLTAIRWAYESAARRAFGTFSPDDGHDAAWLGNTRYTLFRDRLDRVFSCERYAVPDDEDEADPDLLHAELTGEDVAGLPRIEPGRVIRADLYGSPGWAVGRPGSPPDHRDLRFLLAAGDFGFVDTLQWARKGVTKRVVALQRPPASREPELFVDALFGPEEFISAYERPSFALPTYVVAHSLDPASGEIELVFGRPKLKPGDSESWHWFENLLAAGVPAAADLPAEGGKLRLVPGEGLPGRAASGTRGRRRG